MEKEILNVVEAADYLGLSAYTIREYAKAGTIPARKVGKEWRFFKPDLAARVRVQEVEPGKDMRQ